MNLRTLIATLLFGFLAAAPAWAGPPLICDPIQIGSAQSLPWQQTSHWNGAVASYSVSHLIPDTLKLLTPQTSIAVREETLRRAAIYSTRESGLADRLLSSLMARTSGSNEPSTWFDAGYFAEAKREAVLAYMMVHDSAPPSASKAPTQSVDAVALVRKAIHLGGKNMEQAAAIIENAQKTF